MYNRTRRPPIQMIAGDDYCLRVNFTNSLDGTEFIFTENDTIKMVINADEIIEIDGIIIDNYGEFYVSSDITQHLADCEIPLLTYCIHIYWAGGGRNTPIFNAPICVVRCHADEP